MGNASSSGRSSEIDVDYHSNFNKYASCRCKKPVETLWLGEAGDAWQDFDFSRT